jgi:hypothetical protein
MLTAMPGQGIPLGDILADSGYAHRDAAAWAIPLRAAGAKLIQDLHPHDRGPQGTHQGAVISNGRLYPATTGKIRCPLRPSSMTLDRDRPEILSTPEHPQACCTQQTIAIPPDILAKTAQKHDYHAQPDAAPTAAAPAPNAASPPPRTPPPTTSAAAGAASWASRPDAIHHHHAHRPQPAHPRHLDRPPARQRPPRRRRVTPKTRKRRRKTLASPATGPP